MAYKYNVYDGEELILEDAATSEVAEHIGIRNDLVFYYGSNNLRYHKRYKIVRNEEDVEPQPTDLFYQKFGIHAETYDRAMAEFRKKHQK